MTTEYDPVHRPKHYCNHPSGIEAIEIVECMGFLLGNAVKYVIRHEHKGNPIQDLEKALWYVNRELRRRDDGIAWPGEMDEPNSAIGLFLENEPSELIRMVVSGLWYAHQYPAITAPLEQTAAIIRCEIERRKSL